MNAEDGDAAAVFTVVCRPGWVVGDVVVVIWTIILELGTVRAGTGLMVDSKELDVVKAMFDEVARAAVALIGLVTVTVGPATVMVDWMADVLLGLLPILFAGKLFLDLI